MGPGANDLGFVRGPDGAFQALVGVMEQRARGWHGPYDQTRLGRLAAAYAVRQLAAQYQTKGWRVTITRQADGWSSSSRRGEPMPRVRVRTTRPGTSKCRSRGDVGSEPVADELAGTGIDRARWDGRHVYTDTIDLRALGHVRALRASVVEWDECGQAWTAHTLASGTMLGPFTTRAEAVSAERAILATRLDAALDHHAGPQRHLAPIRSRLTRAARARPRTSSPAALHYEVSDDTASDV